MEASTLQPRVPYFKRAKTKFSLVLLTSSTSVFVHVRTNHNDPLVRAVRTTRDIHVLLLLIE